ncbi:MAG: hypothetical protein AAF546_12070 [Verrucomicrobiota bacterium]
MYLNIKYGSAAPSRGVPALCWRDLSGVRAVGDRPALPYLQPLTSFNEEELNGSAAPRAMA